MRPEATRDPLAELIRRRRRELFARIPTLLIPVSFTASGFGTEASENFLLLGMPLYVDSIAVQLRAPITAEQDAGPGSKGMWFDTGSNGLIEISLIQPKGPADGLSPGFYIVSQVSVPVHEREPQLIPIGSLGNTVRPASPLLATVRVVWPGKSSALPPDFPVHLDATVLFAVTAIPKAKQ